MQRQAGAQAENGQGEGGGVGGTKVDGETTTPLPTSQAPAGEDPGAEAPIDPTVDPPVEGLPLLSSEAGWLVRFKAGTKEDQMKEFASERGGEFQFAFKSLPIAYIRAEERDAQAMRQDTRALHVERDAAVEFYDTQTRQAIRQHLVVDPVTGLKDALGNPIDGRGVGVAVVDTGINALHTDLGYVPTGLGGAVSANYKIASLAAIPLPNTDTSSGHGTHVAAIVAGQGTGNVAAKGVATGAKLYGFGAGDANTILWGAASFDWIAQNYNMVKPPIRVVTNSWGSGTTYDPNSALTQFTNLLINKGITVVWAAGNGAGTGATATTSAQCQIPTAGNICVGATDDQNTGNKDGPIASFSSRGKTGDASTWPDIMAPGVSVYSARPPAGYATGSGIADPNYVNLSGTSQAAPHVAGIVALMLQKHPTWSPETVEAKLKCNAYKFSDGASYSSITVSGCYGATAAYDKGAGLADAYAAVSAS